MLALPIALAAVPAAGAKEDTTIAEPVRVVETDENKVDLSQTDDFSGLAVCPTSAAPEILTSGVPSAAGNDTSTTDCHYKITVSSPAGLRLRAVVAWTGASDHDVYVKAGTPATASPYYCSEVGTSTVSPATCSGAATLVAGDYFIRVKRWNGATDYVLTVFLEVPPPTCSLGSGTTPLTDSVTTTASLTADSGANCNFVFAPAVNQDTVSVVMNPAPSDFDLYVKKGSAPTTTVYDCRPYSGGNVTETCSLTNDGSLVYVMVRRFSGSGSFTVTARAFSACSYGNTDQLLSENTPFSASLTADTGGACFVKFDAASGFDLAQLDLTPNAGANFDLYLKAGSRPTTSSYGCRSNLLGNGALDSCAVAGNAGTVYGMIVRVGGSGSFDVTAKSVSSCSLGPGIHPLTGSISASLVNAVGAKCVFEFVPDAGADFASFVLPATTPADFDLYVKKGAVPTTSSWDCRPYLGGSSVETCDRLIEDSTSFFVMVLRYSNGGPFSLSGTNVVIPTLENGIPVSGTAAQNTMTYWKVVVPAANEAGNGPTALAIALAGDATEAACRVSGDTNAVCLTAEAADIDACNQIEIDAPGTCAALGLPAKQLSRTDADLYVRHRAGLPTTSTYNCRGYSYGTVESCTFSNDAVGARAEAATQYGAARTEVIAALGSPCVVVDPAVPAACVPTFPANPSQAQIVSFPGAGKYFIAVRGYTAGASEYNLVAAWV